MRKSLKRMFNSAEAIKRDELYQGLDLEVDGSAQPCTKTVFELISDGDINRVRSFIMKNPTSLYSLDEVKATPLHYAAARGDMELMQMIFEETADEVLNVIDCKGNTPLHWAVENNKIESVRALLCRGANPNILNCYLMSPLHNSIQQFHNKLVEVLINHSSTDINLKGELDNTPVIQACSNNNPEALEMLFANNAKTCKKNKLGCYPIHMAVFACSEKCLELVLKQGEKNGYSTYDHINFIDNLKNSPLHIAVRTGCVNIVKKCISLGARIDQQENDKATALHFAATQGATDIVKLMLTSYTGDKPIINLPDGNKETLLHKSALFDYADLAEYLISMGANMDSLDNESRSPLLLAVTCSAWKTVNLLLSKGANVTIKDQCGRNFLHLTVLQPGGFKHLNKDFLQLDTVKALVSDEDYDGCTPLHYACRQGVPGSVNNLLGLNVSLYSKSKDKRSPLHFAACYGRINTCLRLLRDVTDARLLNEGDETGMTPLHMAAQNGHDKIVNMLLKRGALLLSDYNGWTSLHYATFGGYTRTMQILLDTYMCLIDKVDINGNTALHLASQEGHAKAARLLLDNGASVILNKEMATFIHLAIRGGKKDVAFTAIQSDRLDEIMVTFSHVSSYKCPLLEMIEHLPEAYSWLLDRCRTESPGDKKSRDFNINYNFRYLQCPISFKKLSKEEAGITYEPLISLNAMVYHNRMELLSHPVCKEYLLMKWMAYGFKAHILNLAVYSLGLIPLTLLILNCINPYANNATVIHRPKPLQMKDTYFTRVCMSLVFGMGVFGIIKEVWQIVQQRVKYLMDQTNLIDWTINVTGLIFVSSLCSNSINIGYYQWQCGAIAVFASWLNFLLYLQRFESFGIYIVMFWEILRTLLRIAVLFFFLLLAFGLSFYILLYPQTTFSTPYFSLMQTFSMMLGDINYQDGFLHPLIEDQMPYGGLSVFHLIIFTMLIPILLMNLLIGLAVGDIAEVQRNAALKRIEMQVNLHTSLEKKLPYWLLKRVDKTSITVYPNRPRIWGVAINSPLLLFIFACEGSTPDVPPTDTAVETELLKQKHRMKDMSSLLQKQHELIKLILQKMEIISEAEDEEEQDQQSCRVKSQKLNRKDSKWNCVLKAVKAKAV
uniref:Transient receptor potential cation channel subfamily A member 1 n=1 Tax=Ambystoma mexicanum TaxID=8296 RepID=A0A455R411_AMBME|nr:transient receptor potential ankyrin 1 [Ambystoma mexicanum]